MPADGDALLAQVTAGPGAGDAAGIGAAAAAYFGRVGALRRAGAPGRGFSAADAKREGGALVKLFSAAIKQQVQPAPRTARRPRHGPSRGDPLARAYRAPRPPFQRPGVGGGCGRGVGGCGGWRARARLT